MKPTDSSEAIDLKRAAEVYRALRPILNALPERDIYRGTLNLTRAAINALAAVPHLRAASARIVAELPTASATLGDELEQAALAAAHADLLFGISEDALFADISKPAYELREELEAVMKGLIKRKRVPANILDDVTPGTGYEDLSKDLGKLALRFREYWGKLQGRIDVEPEELDNAEAYATTILTRLAGRKSVSLPDADAEMSVAEQQARAATHLRDTHDRARKAAVWLFWEDAAGVDAKVPSLGAGRGGAAAVPEEAAKEVPVAPKPATDTPSEG